jgi:hypothetical protein
LLEAYPNLTPAQVTQQMRAQATASVLTKMLSGSPNLLLYAPACRWGPGPRTSKRSPRPPRC